jgi:serine/threonine protein kinase
MVARSSLRLLANRLFIFTLRHLRHVICDKTRNQVLYNIPEGPPPRLDESGPFSDELRDFVASSLVLDPHARATAKQLLEHAALAPTRADGGRGALVELLADAIEAREARERFVFASYQQFVLVSRIPFHQNVASLELLLWWWR